MTAFARVIGHRRVFGCEKTPGCAKYSILSPFVERIYPCTENPPMIVWIADEPNVVHIYELRCDRSRQQSPWDSSDISVVKYVLGSYSSLFQLQVDSNQQKVECLSERATARRQW